MTEADLRKLLNDYKSGQLDDETALSQLRKLPYEDLGYAKIDHHRALRTGCTEVIYCAGKTNEQVHGILEHMINRNARNILCTRCPVECYEFVSDTLPVRYDSVARIMIANSAPIEITNTRIAVVAAGTSDLPVAEEAAVTAEVLGNLVDRHYDVGVAGLHRLLDKLDDIRTASVIIAVAGMEGALASVVAGLVDVPVIAVPTSVGYGASFGGMAALLAMLNSCASGITVVNIDNGFGAAFTASMINKTADKAALVQE